MKHIAITHQTTCQLLNHAAVTTAWLHNAFNCVSNDLAMSVSKDQNCCNKTPRHHCCNFQAFKVVGHLNTDNNVHGCSNVCCFKAQTVFEIVCKVAQTVLLVGATSKSEHIVRINVLCFSKDDFLNVFQRQ